MGNQTRKETLDLLAESLRSEWESLVALAPRALVAILVFALFLMVGRVLGRGAAGVLRRGALSPIQQGFFRRVVVWLAAVLGLAAAMNILGLGGAAAGLLAGGGLTAVMLGFAFREIGENFLAGVFLAFSRPFGVGDHIESGDFKGTVRSVELRYTHIRTVDGRDIYIPNARIFKDSLVNYTRDGLLRYTITVGVDYGEDLAEVCRLLLDTVLAVEGVLDDPAPAAVPANLGPSWVEIEVQIWVNTFDEDPGPVEARSAAIDACRRALLDGGHTLSSDVASRLAVDLRQV